MVGFKSLPWLPEQNHRRFIADANKESSKLGILSFETAKTMSKLISLYKSLSTEEISRLKNDVVKSKGVHFLNSSDDEFLLSLACSEKLEDLDRAATTVSWLGKRCSDLGLNRFDIIFNDLKLGLVDLGKVTYASRAAEKKVRKMEKLVSTTSFLHSALEALTEMEVYERKMKQLRNKQNEMVNAFNEKIESHRKEVKCLKEVSLWNKTYDKIVDLMARVVCVLYKRIISVFGPQRKLSLQKLVPHSGPLLTKSKPVIVRFYSRRDGNHAPDDQETVVKNGVSHLAGSETVGGSGLAMHYANLIILVEKYLDSTVVVSRDERESLYQMLPENVKFVLKTKLSRTMRCAENDEMLAEGWKEAMADMMGWLAPMAHDSVRWQMERSFEKMRFDSKHGSVLLMQTLHFADKEKTEAAIAEVLVGLSCIFKFENRPLSV